MDGVLVPLMVVLAIRWWIIRPVALLQELVSKHGREGVSASV
jgi:hypothetical protein